MALVTDIIDPAEMAGFVRELDPVAYGFTLMNDFLPMTDVESNEYRFRRTDATRQPMASYRPWDVEAPIAGRQGFADVRGEIPPISIKIPLGEEMRLFKERLRGNDADLVGALYNDAAMLTEAVLARVEVAIGEALFNAEVTFSNDRGLLNTLKIDYGTTTTITAPGVLWSTTATATPITDLTTMVNEYKAANGGQPPARILGSTKVQNLLLANTSIKNLLTNQGVAPALATIGQVNQVLAAYGLPPFYTYDTLVNIAGANTRVTPLNDIALLPATDKTSFGETQNGLTAEGLELVGSGFMTEATAPGLVAVIDKDFDPVKHWTKVVGVRVPVIKDPKKIAKATVSA